jgi:outer membrane protein assembly factor BamB
MTERQESRRSATLHGAARGVAAASGAFSLAVFALIAANFAQSRSAAPLDSPALERLKAEAAARPGDDALREEIRALDLLVRKAHFTSLAFRSAGAVLLLAGLAVCLASLKLMGTLRPRLPMPPKAGGVEEAPAGPLPLRAVAAVGAALAAFAVVLLILTPGGPAPAAKPDGAGTPRKGGQAPAVFSPPASLPAPPAPAEIAANWPGFRGPGGLGIATAADPPPDWDGAAGRNVLWKAAVPRAGFGSPAVWGERVFLTGGDGRVREVYCFDAATGALRWRWEVQGIRESPCDPPAVSDDTGVAAPSPATDGRLVFAAFATGDVVALDPDGKPAWGRNLGVPDNPYGHAASPAVWRDFLLVPFDDARGGRLFALEARTGATAWETKRAVDPSWSSLAVADTGARWEAVVNANPFVASYDPATGKEWWKAECMSGEVAPSPAYDGGRFFAVNQGASLAAIDAATGKVLWEHLDDLPDVPSPLAAGGLVFLPDSGGRVTCLEAATGKVLWTHDFPEGFYGSPVLAKGRVHVVDRKGITRVFEAAGAFKAAADCPLGEPSVCTPAFAGKRVFLRGEKHLFCLGGK